MGQGATNGGRVALVTFKIPPGAQPDDTTAHRAAVTADHQSGSKAFDEYWHQAVAPNFAVAASAAGAGTGPGIIAAALRNVIEIQVKKRYHGDAFFGRPRGPRVRGRWV